MRPRGLTITVLAGVGAILVAGTVAWQWSETATRRVVYPGARVWDAVTGEEIHIPQIKESRAPARRQIRV